MCEGGGAPKATLVPKTTKGAPNSRLPQAQISLSVLIFIFNSTIRIFGYFKRNLQITSNKNLIITRKEQQDKLVLKTNIFVKY